MAKIKNKKSIFITFILLIVLIFIVGVMSCYSNGGNLTGNLSKLTNSQKTTFPNQATSVQVTGTVRDQNNSVIKNANVQLFYVLENSESTYRYGTVIKQTDSNGKFKISESEFLNDLVPRIGAIQKPYAFFLSVYKDGYLDNYIFDSEEKPKVISSGEWNNNIVLKPLPAKLTKNQGLFSVNYYPGQEQCAQVALNQMAYFYPKVSDLLGIQAPSSTLKLNFKTILQQGEADWTGGALGISGTCAPWTDNIENPQIQAMWNDIMPHEFTHGFVSGFQNLIPYWSNEGIAQYTANKINNTAFSCNPDEFLPVQDLVGEAKPYYESAACFWKLLEDGHPGIIKKTMNYLQQGSLQNQILPVHEVYFTSTKDFLSKVLVKVLSTNYNMTPAAAQTYLNGLMVDFHYNPQGN